MPRGSGYLASDTDHGCASHSRSVVDERLGERDIKHRQQRKNKNRRQIEHSDRKRNLPPHERHRGLGRGADELDYRISRIRAYERENAAGEDQPPVGVDQNSQEVPEGDQDVCNKDHSSSSIHDDGLVCHSLNRQTPESFAAAGVGASHRMTEAFDPFS